MSRAAGASRENLTGIWHGLYTSPGDIGSVSFTATLIESGTSLSGSTHEPCVGPDCPAATLEATLAGARHAQAVSFVKTYGRAGGRFENPVTYEGTLSEDGTEIEGRWTIARDWSGKFLMIRSAGRAETVTRKEVQKA